MAGSLTTFFDPGVVSTRWVDRLTLSRDASMYRLVPQAVVRPRNITDVRRLLSFCQDHHRHLTFRAGGTSLSGQAITDDVLVDISRGWDAIHVHEQGHQITLGPGVTGGRANAALHRHGRKLGPDPASMAAAMIGGIVANNSSGMCCGTADNAYHTLASLDVLCADGTRIDTSLADADERLREQRPSLHASILELRDAVRSNSALVARIRKKYTIKNTMGYAINAFIDEDLPARIIARLMVGSEGTLGFIVSATFNTILDAQQKWTCMDVFQSLDEACDAALNWQEAGASAIELMDDASLQSFASLAHTPDEYRISRPGAAAVLVEFHNTEPLADRPWITDPKEQAVLWRLRKGLMPSIGAQRASGETMINEDIAVAPYRLAQLVKDVKGAFVLHGYQKAIIFGHAKDGNIHFVVNQRFEEERDVARYDAFIREIAEIVVGKHDGSLKAEHGTGRNMAPFLEQEWGTDAVEVMRRVKQLLDPGEILNPGVVLNNDPLVHLANIKPVPTVDPEVDTCIECGFCEHVCPTRDATLTPRQRIVLRRELKLITDPAIRAEVQRAESYFSIATCAVDSLCATACPVDIDTGELIKRIRSDQAPKLVNQVADVAAQWYNPVSKVIGVAARALLRKRVHLKLGRHEAEDVKITERQAFLPSCPARWFDTHATAMHTIAHIAGIELVLPKVAASLCCGQPFESNGFSKAHETITAHLLEALEGMRAEGITVLVTDTNTCAAALTSLATELGWTVVSPAQWLYTSVIPNITFEPLPISVAVHPGCGSAKLMESDVVLAVVQQLARSAMIPASSACCGMAGVHGLQYPEVPRTSLRSMRTELSEEQVDLVITGNTLCSSAIEKYTHVPTVTLIELAVATLTRGTLVPST